MEFLFLFVLLIFSIIVIWLGFGLLIVTIWLEIYYRIKKISEENKVSRFKKIIYTVCVDLIIILIAYLIYIILN
jgi:hypothetical protein